MPERQSPIIRREDIPTIRDADALFAKAQAALSTAQEQAEQLRIAATEEAARHAAEQSVLRISSLISKAEREVTERLQQLEPEIAGLVADVVRQVVGDMDRTEAIRAATQTALHRFREHRQIRLTAAPDIVEDVLEAVPPGPEIAVRSDPRLDAGRVILSSDRAHADIGLAELLDAALAPWTEASEGGAAAEAKTNLGSEHG